MYWVCFLVTGFALKFIYLDYLKMLFDSTLYGTEWAQKMIMVRRDMEGDGYALVGDTNPTFGWQHWGRSQKPVRIAKINTEYTSTAFMLHQPGQTRKENLVQWSAISIDPVQTEITLSPCYLNTWHPAREVCSCVAICNICYEFEAKLPRVKHTMQRLIGFVYLHGLLHLQNNI
jgi:hypothetical protein